MDDVINKILEGGSKVYFPDCIGKILIGSGHIREINERRGTFNVRVYHDDYRDFKFSEYGKWVFSTEEELKKAIQKIPERGQTVYYITENQIIKEEVIAYKNYIGGSRLHMYVQLSNNEEVHIDEIGQTLFTTLSEAEKHLK